MAKITHVGRIAHDPQASGQVTGYLDRVNERMRRHFPAGDDGLDPYGWTLTDRYRGALDNPEDYPEIWAGRRDEPDAGSAR